MKNARQGAILKIIESMDISTQGELAEELRRQGVKATQATISRDIKDLHLYKTPNEYGIYRYQVGEVQEDMTDRLNRMLRDSVLEIQSANNQIVIHTLSGSAQVVGEAVDSMHWQEVLGTIAGDNTLLVIVRSDGETGQVRRRIEEIVYG